MTRRRRLLLFESVQTRGGNYVSGGISNSFRVRQEGRPIVLDRAFDLWIYADDCDAAVDRLRSEGVQVDEEPADQPWGERMARVKDPDGNRVIIAERSG